MKWKDDAGHGIHEGLIGVANCVTMIVPFFCGLAAGLAVDAAHKARAKIGRDGDRPS